MSSFSSACAFTDFYFWQARSLTMLPAASVTMVFEIYSVVPLGRNNSCTGMRLGYAYLCLHMRIISSCHATVYTRTVLICSYLQWLCMTRKRC